MRTALAALQVPLALLCAAVAGTAAAAAPALPAYATSIEAFVPAGWQVEQRQTADLNRDGRPDAVLLLRADGTPPAAAAPASGAASAAARSPERLLAVLQAVPGGWRLAGANARLVPQVDLASQEDPLANGELAAGKGSASLSLGASATAGSYLSAVLRWRFRIEPGCVRLIGFDRLQTHRATLETQDLSINFLTGAVLHSQGNAQGDTTAQRREKLAANPRRCLPDLGDGFSFDPLAR